jgi:hypothetical protein
MGRLIKKMQQARHKMQQARDTVGPRQRRFREGRHGKRHRGQFREESGWYGPQERTNRWGSGPHHRRFGRYGQCAQRPYTDRCERGFDQCGFDRRGRRMQCQGCGKRDMDVPEGFERRCQGQPCRSADEPMRDTKQDQDIDKLMQDIPTEDFNWD